MMTGSMEEGLLDGSSLRKASWRFHVTANIVLSSSVAACGYFAYGFAVSITCQATKNTWDIVNSYYGDNEGTYFFNFG